MKIRRIILNQTLRPVEHVSGVILLEELGDLVCIVLGEGNRQAVEVGHRIGLHSNERRPYQVASTA